MRKTHTQSTLGHEWHPERFFVRLRLLLGQTILGARGSVALNRE
jgi:hypothetical protein